METDVIGEGQTPLSLILDEIKERAKGGFRQIESIDEPSWRTCDIESTLQANSALVKALCRAIQFIHVSNHAKAEADIAAILNQK